MKKEKIRNVFIVFLLTMAFIVTVGAFYPKGIAVLTGSDDVVTERLLVPGGQSVGIQMEVQGALIVGVENDVGPRVGDMITSIDNNKVETATDVLNATKEVKTYKITVSRDGKEKSYNIKPRYDSKTKQYKLGLWVKEKIAGIGTITFYDIKTNKIATLGHGIYESKTGKLLDSKSGRILQTKVYNVTAGAKGKPGEIGGIIYNFQAPIGTIEKNTDLGVYAYAENIDIGFERKAMVMASQEEIRKGEAYILTTIDGTDINDFNIEITKIHHQNKADSKGIEFKVTDKELIKKCGGIVQGMSGSPIIQNNRIIGAVTHVFVNSPKNGYGIFAEWMVKELEK